MSFKIEVWGDYACFTRPEMVLDRVSYDVMTPLAARGLLESIYWHPGLQWIVDRIYVCNPIVFADIYQGGVNDATVLKNVRYVIEAHFKMTDNAAPSDNHGKFTATIKRRLKRGQFYKQPCFGLRKYPAQFAKFEGVPECPRELRGRKDLGWMLLDMDFSDPDNLTPMFFRAELVNGVLTVPPADRRLIRR